MTNLPFHDGRSFAMYLRDQLKLNGLDLKEAFSIGVIEDRMYRRYLNNEREPKISTANQILARVVPLKAPKNLVY